MEFLKYISRGFFVLIFIFSASHALAAFVRPGEQCVNQGGRAFNTKGGSLECCVVRGALQWSFPFNISNALGNKKPLCLNDHQSASLVERLRGLFGGSGADDQNFLAPTPMPKNNNTKIESPCKSKKPQNSGGEKISGAFACISGKKVCERSGCDAEARGISPEGCWYLADSCGLEDAEIRTCL